MIPILISSMLLIAPAQNAPTPQPAPSVSRALSFASQRIPFKWDQLIPMNLQVDGVKVNSIFFNRKDVHIIKTVELGTRAQLDVTNSASGSRRPGFAVAVFDREDRLLGVASGGPAFGSLAPGETGTYDLDFSHVLERLPNGAYFVLSLELSQ